MEPKATNIGNTILRYVYFCSPNRDKSKKLTHRLAHRRVSCSTAAAKTVWPSARTRRRSPWRSVPRTTHVSSGNSKSTTLPRKPKRLALIGPCSLSMADISKFVCIFLCHTNRSRKLNHLMTAEAANNHERQVKMS